MEKSTFDKADELNNTIDYLTVSIRRAQNKQKSIEEMALPHIGVEVGEVDCRLSVNTSLAHRILELMITEYTKDLSKAHAEFDSL